jgi:hypothetical protein
MKITKSIIALSTVLLCIPVKADSGAVSFVKDVTILVAMPFVAAIKSLGALLISQAKKHPKAFCVTAATAALVYGAKVSCSSLVHARHVVHSVKNKLDTMQSEGNQIIPEEVQICNSDGSIPSVYISASNPQFLLNTLIPYLRDVLNREQQSDLKKLGICLCQGHSMIARFDNAFEQRKIELENLQARLATCKQAGKMYYRSKIEELNRGIADERTKTFALQAILRDYERRITDELPAFKGLSHICHKRYCMNKQLPECICNGSDSYGCPVCYPSP